MERTELPYMPENTRPQIADAEWNGDSLSYAERQKRDTMERLKDGTLEVRGFGASLIELSDFEEDWMVSARCREVTKGKVNDQFFPNDGPGVDAARRICAQCTVQTECLDYALERGIEHGVWGGASERERKRIRRSK